MLFDSHSRTRTGAVSRTGNGPAVLISFSDINQLVTALRLPLSTQLGEYGQLMCVFADNIDLVAENVVADPAMPTAQISQPQPSVVPTAAKPIPDSEADEEVHQSDDDDDEYITRSQVARSYPSYAMQKLRHAFKFALQGSISETDMGRGSSSKGLRSYNICVFAAGFVHTKTPAREWTAETLDSIVRLGYSHHSFVKAASGLLSANIIFSLGVSVNFGQVKQCTFADLLTNPSWLTFPEDSTVVVSYKNFNVLISFHKSQQLKYYTIFDPHERSLFGGKTKAKQSGGAIVLGLFRLEDVVACLHKTLGAKDNRKRIIVTARKVVHMHAIVRPAAAIHESRSPVRFTQSGRATRFTDTVMTDMDTAVPTVASEFQLADGEELTTRHLHRATTTPVNTTREKSAEEYSWFYLFPDGKNGRHEPRQVKLSALDYFQARLLGNEPRFRRNDYLFYALSNMEAERARQTISVCAKNMRTSNAPGELPERFVNNAHIYLRGIRGTNQYWRAYCSDVIAMTQNLGPPTWFLTFSCNDFNWTDILKACLIAEGHGDVDPSTLTFQEKQKLIENNPIALSRQYMVRFRKLFNFLKSSETVLGGRVVDYTWRIEFQARGSPHVHCLVWIANAPDFRSPEGKQLIDDVIRCDLPPEADGVNADNTLHKLVKTVSRPICCVDLNYVQCNYCFVVISASSS